MKKNGRLAIVVSRFNQMITERLLSGALERLQQQGIVETQIDVVWVPGAVEIPLIAQQFANKKTCKAVICLGAVIRGETDHYQYVCQQVSQGCQQVALQHNIPVIFGVLTTDTEEQAMARVGWDQNHKGREAADAALEMIELMRKIETV